MKQSHPGPTQAPKELSVEKKPLSIKRLQVLFLVWGSLSLINPLINFIFNVEWIHRIPSSLNILPLLMGIVLIFTGTASSELTYLNYADTTLFPIIVGIGAIIISLGLFHYTKNSLIISRLYVIILILIMGSYFLLTFPSFINNLGILFEYFGTRYFIALIIPEFLFVATIVALVFTLHKIQKLLRTGLFERKTFLSPFGMFRKLLYVPLILILIGFGYVLFTHYYYQSLPPTGEYGTLVSADSPKIISESKTSPNDAYTVKEYPRPEVQQIGFGVYDKNGNYLTSVTYNSKLEVPNDIYRIQKESYDYTASFKGWVNNHTFVIETIKEDGTEYENIIDIKRLLK
jgi:hypothetical protein